MQLLKMITLVSLLLFISNVVAQELPISCNRLNSNEKISYRVDDLIFATKNNLIFQHDNGVSVSHIDINAETFVQVKQRKQEEVDQDANYSNRALVKFGDCSDVRASLSTWLLD
jgi:hypothetical protein